MIPPKQSPRPCIECKTQNYVTVSNQINVSRKLPSRLLSSRAICPAQYFALKLYYCRPVVLPGQSARFAPSIHRSLRLRTSFSLRARIVSSSYSSTVPPTISMICSTAAIRRSFSARCRSCSLVILYFFQQLNSAANTNH